MQEQNRVFKDVLETAYPGMSPQLLARTRQMWLSKRMDLDGAWHETVARLRGFRPCDPPAPEQGSQRSDGFFVFDQCVIWVASLNDAAHELAKLSDTKLTSEQWRSIDVATFRLLERLDAVRLLLVTELPSASYQLARSISEDIDLCLALLCRPKLSARFVECQSADAANEFWRRHVAGGRAFKSVSAELYKVGLDLGPGGDYESWRNQVKTVLGSAVHTSFRPGQAQLGSDSDSIRDCLNFVTMRLQEFCAYAHVLRQEFREDLERPIRLDEHQMHGPTSAGQNVPHIGEVIIDQLSRNLFATLPKEADSR